jgi:hypothetical protein
VSRERRLMLQRLPRRPCCPAAWQAVREQRPARHGAPESRRACVPQAQLDGAAPHDASQETRRTTPALREARHRRATVATGRAAAAGRSWSRPAT